MPTEQHLLLRLREGEAEALPSLMWLYYNDLFRYGMKFCADKEVCKEILSRYFLHIWDHRESLVVVENVKGYLVTAFRRFLLAQLQQLRQYHYFFKQELENDDVAERPYEAILIRQEQQEELQTALQMAIADLPPRQKELLKLRFYDEMSYEEIAIKTSLSVRTIYNKMHEALKKLHSSHFLQDVRKLLSVVL